MEEPQNFYYSSLGTIGIIRIYITNIGTNELVARLQQCYLPYQSYFTHEKDFIDECTALPNEQCVLVVKACNFDPSSRYFVNVESTGSSPISFEIKAIEEDFTNVLTMHNAAYYANSLDNSVKYPFKSYKFEIPEDENTIVDVFVRHKGYLGTLNFYITPNKTGDLDCSLTNATILPGEYHVRLTRECLEDYKDVKTFYVSLTSNSVGNYKIDYEVRISVRDKVKYESFEKEISSKEFFISPYSSLFFEKEISIDKNNSITTFTLQNAYPNTPGSARLLVSDEKDPNDLCYNVTYSCIVNGNDACSVELESCKRTEKQIFYISTSSTYSTLTKVPLSLSYEVKEFPIVKITNETYERNVSSEWSFFEFDTEYDYFSSNVVDIEIESTGTDSLEIHVTRDGITKGGNCGDEVIRCEGNTLCKASLAFCDFNFNGTSVYLSIRSLPAFTSKYNLTVNENAHTLLSHDKSKDNVSISTYETHMYNIEDAKERPGLVTLEFEDSSIENSLILSIVSVNESNCPIQLSCTVNSIIRSCSLPLICVDEDQQPYFKVTTDKKEYGTVTYNIIVSSLNEKIMLNGTEVSLTVESEKWIYIEEKYDVNIRYTVNVTGGVAQLNMYRDCTELITKNCETDEDCILFANRNDIAYGGTYWLRIRPESDSSSTSVDVKVTTGIENCVNVTTDFCGALFADVSEIDIIVNDQLANDSYNALRLSLSNMSCPGIKEYVCGIYFPICGEFGTAPAVCKESCIDAFESCYVSSTCPYEFCERLPDCPVPPPPKKFYGGYIALIIIYSLLAIGIAFTVLVIVIRGK